MRIVNGLESICDRLDVCPKVVKSLARHGAPIKVVGSRNGTRYMVDMDALERWFALPAGKAAVRDAA